MRVEFSSIKNREVYIWGKGTLFIRYIGSLKGMRIKAVIDNDEKKWNKTSEFDKLDCIPPVEAVNSCPVIVAVEDPVAITDITEQLDEQNFLWCHIFEAIDSLFMEKYVDQCSGEDSIPIMRRFIDVMLPVTSCNFKCRYCYLSQLEVDHVHLPNIYHNEKYIRYALRKSRLGGTAFINICGIGETLLCKELIPIVYELVREGHYIQIVTNATSTRAINDLIGSNIDPEHMFVKCSLHWNELKKRKLLSKYADNVNALMYSGISITVELVPDDDIVDEIPQIKKYCIENFGAMPHVTVTRDESKKDFPIITNYTEEEYEKIWSVFKSSMFDFKIRNRNRYKDCYAGLWAGELNLATGELYKCTGNSRICNIYENPDEAIPFEKVGDRCALPYCFNCHAYLTLGLVPEVNAPDYLGMRDRTTSEGKHWINGKIREVFKQKLYENNL